MNAKELPNMDNVMANEVLCMVSMMAIVLPHNNEPVSSMRYKLVCAYSEDSNQSEHPQSPSFLPELNP